MVIALVASVTHKREILKAIIGQERNNVMGYYQFEVEDVVYSI